MLRSPTLSAMVLAGLMLPAAGGAQAPAAPALTPPAPEDPAVELFVRKCASCHTVGKGQRVGPDLKGALDRRDRALGGALRQGAEHDARHATRRARQLLTQFAGVRMPDLGLARRRGRRRSSSCVARCSAEPCDLAGKFTPVTDGDGRRRRARARSLPRPRGPRERAPPSASRATPCAARAAAIAGGTAGEGPDQRLRPARRPGARRRAQEPGLPGDGQGLRRRTRSSRRGLRAARLPLRREPQGARAPTTR